MDSYEAFKPREIEILQLMADGLTNREIAGRLYIGVETVRWYAKQIYSRLDVSGREEAARKAQSLGLLDDRLPDGQAALQPEHNLPPQLTSFVGRESQIDAVTALLGTSRLLTLTGPGGTGKTRLSLKVAERLLSDFADGVYFVDLAPVSDSALVAQAVAHTLSIVESGDLPIIDALKRAIGQRAILLILDNYEHVIGAASIVPELLASAPRIKIIVTSREPLRVSGEQVYPVPPLTLPATHPTDPAESVSLFAQRSQAVKPGFKLDETTAHAVAEICQRLDGMPLAIELAASLSRFLTPNAILAHMEDRFQNLKGGLRDAPARQQTLRNTIDWSYNLLQAGEKILFARLAVFYGGHSLDAVEAVCSDGLPTDVFEGLAALVDKSMIRQIEDFNGEPRFVMLETIHEYAAARLEESGEAEVLRQRHAAYFADLTAYAHAHLRQTGQDYWFQRLNIEHDNIRAALHWALTGGDAEIGLRLVAALQDFWFYEGYHIGGLRWVGQALEHLEDVEPLLQIGVLETGSILSYGRQELQQAVSFMSQALAIAQALGDERKLAWVLVHQAQVVYDASSRSQQDYDDAVSICEAGLAIFRKLGDKVGLAQGLNVLGNLHNDREVYPLAKSIYEDCLDMCYVTGERRREVMALGNLCNVYTNLGLYDAAEQNARQTLQLAWEIRFSYILALELGVVPLASLVRKGQAEDAARLLGASDALQAAMNIRLQPTDMRDAARSRASVRQQLDEATFQAAYEAGRKMSLDEAVAFAQAALGKTTQQAPLGE